VRRRPRRTVPAVIMAVVLLGVCVVTAISVVQLLLHQRPLVSYAALASAAHTTRWDSAAVAAGGGVLVLVGLVLLLAALLPGRPTVVPLRATEAGMDTGASRRSLRSTLRAAANSVDGVTATTLTVRGKKITAAVRTHRTAKEGLAEAVRAAISRRLDQISPATRPQVRVRVSAPRSTP